ncbi:hypothetical protein CPB84DRAFT_1793589 [Gymnopilus junonius]|uniref:tRNA-splicing endonuclease subunit Sen54 N-terminal domain-containing protein n=1 Tax=Gymnopilus junonius TaxID=109634 RepID=A0A9P5THQ5_GYMJU|nr:hypothetical protein CPB84DRAFT_1793589 [Gymnopilus junonius]
MDDSLEIPTALPPKAPLGDLPPEVEDEQSSDEEDGGLDWTKLLPPSARPVIPKRGEKEFEPRGAGGTNLQQHVLDRARSAMFQTLRSTRTISRHCTHSRYVARGIHFSNMGHSAPRSVLGEDGTEKMQKRLELLPEEAIYLIERGSLFCWKQMNLDIVQIPGLSEVEGSPMSVQQAFSEMIGKEDLTLEKFQVYAYLKRLGYVVTRANPPDPYYPLPPPILDRLKAFFPLWLSTVSQTLFGSFNWWRPICLTRWLHHDKNYSSLFRSLRFMSSGHSVPLKFSESVLEARNSTPYRIFYNLYKPSTPFKKSAPPPPDFQIVVIKTLPDTKIFPWFFPSITRPVALTPWPRKPNPFVTLKTGKKIIIIAAVDNGNTSFFRFGQGEFSEWPML